MKCKKNIGSIGLCTIILSVFFFGVSLIGGVTKSFAIDFTPTNIHYNHTTKVYSFDSGGVNLSSANAISFSISLGISNHDYNGGSCSDHECHGTANSDPGSSDFFTCDDSIFINTWDGAVEYDSPNFTVSSVDSSCASPTPTPTLGPTPTTGPTGMIPININPTAQAKVNAAVSSIPATAISEVFKILPKAMPYLILIVTIVIAFHIVRWIMRIADNDDLSDTNIMIHAKKDEVYNADKNEWEKESTEV